MTNWTTRMTFGEQWVAIKQGDIGCIIASAIEFLIFLIPIGLLVGVWYTQS
jgi:hypothetical protein